LLQYYDGMEGWHVMAIEDDWRMRKLIRANLEALGIEVEEAVNGRHGLQLLGEGRAPDLILLDLDVPDMDAPSLLGALRALATGRRVPIIVMSAEPLAHTLKRGTETGYLRKPFGALALLQQVRGVLSDRATGHGKAEDL
jgi:DNA-binding response OmpR family regulator